MGAVANPTSQTRENEDQSAQWVMGLEMPSSDHPVGSTDNQPPALGAFQR